MVKTTLVIILLVCGILFAENSVKADPDYTFTGFEYARITIVKIGDYLNLKYLQSGGFIEVRDEECFNYKLIPNHNWRGYFFLYSNIITKNNPEKKVLLNIGYEHESAHPTMGIKKSTTNPYEKIYDDQYRNINLNSLLLRYNRISFFGQNTFSIKFDYQFYFSSNNTPELTGNPYTISHGLSLGMEYTRRINELIDIYISAFDRYIFKGRKDCKDNIYKGDSVVNISYPIINEVNTVTAKTGLLFNMNKIKRQAEVYFSILYGNIFGFVDSRDKRFRLSGGVCISS